MALSLLFLALAVAGAVLLVRAFRGEGRRSDPQEGRGHALVILEERYAQGEIARDEFEERRETLLQ